MNNNEILVRKAIEDKEREANSYEDQGCYNAAYCYGYAAGASDALSSLKQPDPKELYIIRTTRTRTMASLTALAAATRFILRSKPPKPLPTNSSKRTRRTVPRTLPSPTPSMIASAISRKTRCMLSANGRRTLLEAITISTRFSAFLSLRTEHEED